MIARNIQDLDHLKRCQNLDSVTVDVAKFKYNGLLNHAFRLAFFAVRVGGLITVIDQMPMNDQFVGPYLMGWPTVRAIAVCALCPDCDREPATGPNELRFRRVAPAPPAGWSAGVIFSGRDEELPLLYNCLDGLIAQDELRGECGEIIVCGPTRDLGFLSGYPDVRYLVFENDEVGPFPISRKKNYLLSQMRFHRCIIFHARIKLDPGALAKAPVDFDIISPNVFFEDANGREPNIGYTSIDPRWPHLVPWRFGQSTTRVDPRRYLTMLRRGIPFVDGGVFAVTKRVFSICPLNDNLRWGECEDLEWCYRARANGFLIDMSPEMSVTNAVSKVRSLTWLPRTVAYGLRALSRVRQSLIRRFLRARESIAGR